MNRYQLPDHVHFCEIGGQRVFLDLVADRYFSLPPAADRAFSALVRGTSAPAAELDALQGAGLLVTAPAGRPPVATAHPAPERSLVEEVASSRVSWSALPEVLQLVLWARRAVSRKQLPRLLGQAGRDPSSSSAQARREQAVQTFLQARRLVPVAPNCLYDSLALHRFLRRRSIGADIVIGAKLHPFGAHCWLQHGSTVLNDTLAAARGFAPILVA